MINEDMLDKAHFFGAFISCGFKEVLKEVIKVVDKPVLQAINDCVFLGFDETIKGGGWFINRKRLPKKCHIILFRDRLFQEPINFNLAVYVMLHELAHFKFKHMTHNYGVEEEADRLAIQWYKKWKNFGTKEAGTTIEENQMKEYLQQHTRIKKEIKACAKKITDLENKQSEFEDRLYKECSEESASKLLQFLKHELEEELKKRAKGNSDFQYLNNCSCLIADIKRWVTVKVNSNTK